MAINKEVYPDYTTISGTDIVVTNNLSTLIKNDNVEIGKSLDQSNIFGVVDHKKNGLKFCGNSILRIDVPNTSSTPTEYKFTRLPDAVCNIRLVMQPASSCAGSFSLNNLPKDLSFYNCSNYKDFFTKSGNVSFSKKIFNKSVTVSVGPMNGNDFGPGRLQFVNSCILNKIWYNITGLYFIDKNKSYHQVQYSLVKPQDNTAAGVEYEEDLWYKGIHSKYGYLIGCYGMTNYYENTKINTIMPIAERVVEDSVMYNSIPVYFNGTPSHPSKGSTSCYYIADSTSIYNTSCTCAYSTNVYDDTKGITVDDTREDVLSKYVLGSCEGEVSFLRSEIISGVPYKGGMCTALWNGNDLQCFCVMPLKEIMHQLSLTQCRFGFGINYTDVQEFNDKVYCGIRNSEGIIEGDWIQGESIRDNLPDYYISDDVNPVDPENPYDNSVMNYALDIRLGELLASKVWEKETIIWERKDESGENPEPSPEPSPEPEPEPEPEPKPEPEPEPGPEPEPNPKPLELPSEYKKLKAVSQGNNSSTFYIKDIMVSPGFHAELDARFVSVPTTGKNGFITDQDIEILDGGGTAYNGYRFMFGENLDKYSGTYRSYFLRLFDSNYVYSDKDSFAADYAKIIINVEEEKASVKISLYETYFGDVYEEIKDIILETDYVLKDKFNGGKGLAFNGFSIRSLNVNGYDYIPAKDKNGVCGFFDTKTGDFIVSTNNYPYFEET